MPYFYKPFFQVWTLLELLGDCIMKVVTAGNCYVYWVCFFDGSVMHNCLFFVMNSFFIYYGPAVAQFSNMDCGCLQYGVGSSFGCPHLIAIIIIITPAAAEI